MLWEVDTITPILKMIKLRCPRLPTQPGNDGADIQTQVSWDLNPVLYRGKYMDFGI